MMRLGLVIYGSLETLSGGYLYDRQLVNHARADGHDVTVVSLPWRGYAQHLGDNFDGALVKQLAALQVDLLLQDELNHPSLVRVNRQLNARTGPPLVSIVHHLRSHEPQHGLMLPVYRRIERAYLRQVDGFVYNSATTRRTVEAEIGQAKPGIVAYPAADHLTPPGTRTIHGLIQQRLLALRPLRLISVGNILPRKGLHHVIAAMALLPKGAVTLDLVGDRATEPAYVHRLDQQIQELGLADAVTFRGIVSDAGLAEIFQTAHLLAMPAFEGFGIVYMEAMAYGLPVIASTTGAAGEIVRDGVNGFLVRPGDVNGLAAILGRLANELAGPYVELAYAARARYDAHPTWRQTTTRILAWLADLIEQRQRR